MQLVFEEMQEGAGPGPFVVQTMLKDADGKTLYRPGIGTVSFNCRVWRSWCSAPPDNVLMHTFSPFTLRYLESKCISAIFSRAQSLIYIGRPAEVHTTHA